MFRHSIALAACVLSVGAGLAVAQAPKPAQPAQTAQPRSGETYLWHGELVSVDAKGILTVRARVLGDVATEVGRFNAGDRVLLTWSGLDIHAGAVRRVTKYEPGQQILDFFALPVELASRDIQNDTMSFRVRVPEAAVGAIKGMKPGGWVTVTTRHRPKGDADVIVAVTGYVKSQT
ncbi:MAG: hypothetical protein HYU37_14100 [Acidobacteria bacterium]|nr:hypothetical protein [Acidobacteriota bacterium]